MIIRVYFQHIILCKQSVALRIPCNFSYNLFLLLQIYVILSFPASFSSVFSTHL